MIQLCYLCNKIYGTKAPYDDPSPTHGICDECFPEYLEKMRKERDEYYRTHGRIKMENISRGRRLKSFEFEIAIPVSQYIELGEADINNVWDQAQEDYIGAKQAGYDEIKEVMRKRVPKNLDITKVEFVEFDSGNWTHSGAYWNVTVSGPHESIFRLKKAYKEYYGEEREV